MNVIDRRALPFVLALALAGCAVRLGGPRTVVLRTTGLYADGGVSAVAAGQWLSAAAIDVALVAAHRDTAWFEEAADSAGLHVSGPGRVDGLYLGFLAMEPLGDTTIALEYDDGNFVLHDALYQVGEDRLLDLLAFSVDDGVPARPLIRSLLRYVATDVGATAAVVIGVAAESEAAGDSVAAMLSPAFTDVRRCMAPEARDTARTVGPNMRLFFGPEARLACQHAEPVEGPGTPALAELVMSR